VTVAFSTRQTNPDKDGSVTHKNHIFVAKTSFCGYHRDIIQKGARPLFDRNSKSEARNSKKIQNLKKQTFKKNLFFSFFNFFGFRASDFGFRKKGINLRYGSCWEG